jgi:hypothetical protein
MIHFFSFTKIFRNSTTFKVTISITMTLYLISVSACIFLSNNSYLQGNWSLERADRNGRKTGTFDGTYMNFWHEDSLETNYIGDIIKTNYKYSKKTIFTNDKLPEMNVISCEKDTLNIQFNIDGNHFQFIMSKVKP